VAINYNKPVTLNISDISVRFSKLNDLTAIQNMFVATISAICQNDYSPEQIKAWISSIENKQAWMDKLASQYFLVAELDQQIVGFASLEHQDYLDLLYVHKDYQRQGIANKLYAEIEKTAIKKKAKVLRSDVSKTATPFFEKQGFKAIETQVNIRQGVAIINYKMVKPL
jgi:putative acetyltransferase